MKSKSVLKGAFILSLGGILTKLLGAVYRIPLTNLLGAKGIGLYQMVFPLYSLLLTFSSTGVPSGMSKLIAEGNNPKTVLKSSLKVFVGAGAVLSVVMAVFSKVIATVQGNSDASVCYLLLSPSVVAVSIISCFRGYFQGFSDMRPTAVSQVLEQSVKLTLGLTLCYIARNDTVLSVSLAILSVTVSEIITLLYFVLKAKRKGVFQGFLGCEVSLKPIFYTVIPMMAITLIIPLIRTVDSFLIINVISRYSARATELYGLLTGAVESIVSLPVSACYALAVTSIPIISNLKKQGGNYGEKCLKVATLTLLAGGLLGFLTYAFAPLGIKLLYGGLSAESKAVATEMLRVSSLSVIFLSLMQTTVACVNAIGKFKVTLVSGIIAGAVKITLSIILLSMPKINVFGAIYSDIACYFVACFINLGYIIYNNVFNSVSNFDSNKVHNVQNYNRRVRG